mgnify:CR=1 FL=1
MGNDISTEQNKSDASNIHKIVNHIASDYIFTSNFKDMENLGDVKYCNNLVILTSRIIEENLNDLDIDYLSRKIKDDNAVDEMAKEKVIFLKKDDIPKLDVKNDTQKRRLCVGIAKYYVKVAHIFASIVKTINPTMSYIDNKGNAAETTLMDKHKVSDNANMKMNSVSLCSKRLDILVNNNDYDVKDTKNKKITVGPDYCNTQSKNMSVNLLEEPGMVELEKLYSDKYDYETGKYIGMSDTMKNKYKRDLEIFYNAFSDSGEPFNPKKIKKFSDIKLREHHNNEGCSDKDGYYLNPQKGEYSEKLFADYATHIKKMMDNTKKNQDQLLSVIDKLFVFVNISDESKKDSKLIMINPGLTEVKLQSVVDESRKIIMNLYITCEKDFLKGLEIFEVIVEQKLRDATIEKINNLGIRKDTERRVNRVDDESETHKNEGDHRVTKKDDSEEPDGDNENPKVRDNENPDENPDDDTDIDKRTLYDTFKDMTRFGNKDDPDDDNEKPIDNEDNVNERRGTNEDRDEKPEDKDRIEKPEEKARIEKPEDKARIEKPEDKARIEKPEEKDRNEKPEEKDRNEKPEEKARIEKPSLLQGILGN